MRQATRDALVILILLGAMARAQTADRQVELPAFSGAVGQGAAAAGGRGGDVYHVANLRDYNRDNDESLISGSLRHAIESANGPRTIVFDVAGPLPLARSLVVRKNRLTIAGQTSPGGVTLWGYPFEVEGAKDVVIRFLRIRTGDFHARHADPSKVTAKPVGRRGNNDLDAGSANAVAIGRGADRVIADHVSASWGMDETFSVTVARNVTIQHCLIAESLDHSYHAKGNHGYDSLVRGEVTPEDQATGTSGYTLYGNLWAHHQQRSPSTGGQQSLPQRPIGSSPPRGRRQSLVNNVTYDWGQRPTHRSLLGPVRINFIGNYHVNGPAKADAYVFYEGVPAPTQVYQRGNSLDANQDGTHNGQALDTAERVEGAFRGFDAEDKLTGGEGGEPFNFFDVVAEQVVPGEVAYWRVVRSAGASLSRDAVDRRVVDSLVHRTGGICDSQEQFRDASGKLPGIDDLPTAECPAGFDTDRDGMPNEFELSHGLDPDNPADGNGTTLSREGYTNLEVYLHQLVAEGMPQ